MSELEPHNLPPPEDLEEVEILTPQERVIFDRLCSLGYFSASEGSLSDTFGFVAGIEEERMYDSETGQQFGGDMAVMGDFGPWGIFDGPDAQRMFKYVLHGDTESMRGVAQWYRQHFEEQERYRHTQSSPTRNGSKENGKAPQSGYIYIIKTGEHYKIGKAQDYAARHKTHQTSNPLPVETVFQVAVDDMVLSERHLHDLFAEKRGLGEWFTLDESDLTAIAAYFESLDQ